MLTKEENKIIEKYVNEKYYDKAKLIKYLNMHEFVGNEIFSYCDKKIFDKPTYSSYLDSEKGYEPIDKATFIKRIPFYFYTVDINNVNLDNMGNLNYLYLIENFTLEELFSALEYMFYVLKLSLKTIFNYHLAQTGNVCSDLFPKWNHYLHLCTVLGEKDYCPEHFITAYNYLREKSNLQPIIYEISDYYILTPFFRDGRKFIFEGIFPVDENNEPIMKWIGLKATNIESVTCNCKKSRSGKLEVIITPKTVIHALNYYNNQDEKEDCWYQIYAGPQNMDFDYQIIKESRIRLGFTQKQVADAVGTSVRTYQKWEAGESIPDGYFLIRLLNWLDISDIQSIIKYQ